MPHILKSLSFALFLALFSSSVIASQQVYRVTQLRAAPGALLEVIELVKADIKNHEEIGIEKPYLMRHSQGDQWDLLYMYPVASVSKDQSRSFEKSKSIGKKYGDPFFAKVSWQQEGYVHGPSKREFTNSFSEFGYYHVEIFTSLAGKQAELLKQREMENVYLRDIGRRENHIYTRAFGPSWDIFTIGFYKGIKDYAASADIPAERKEAAAKKAGFKGTSTIGSYLRELLLEHHDTLAGAVRAN